MQIFKKPLFWAIAAFFLQLPSTIQAGWELLSDETLLIVIGRRWGNTDALTSASTWFPLASSVAGLVLLVAIFHQTRRARVPRHRSGLPLADPDCIPEDRRVRRKWVRIAEWGDERNVISNIGFEECIIEGPAVLATTGLGNLIDSPTFEEPSVPVMVTPPGFTIFGILGMNGCTFRRCSFRRVGLATTADNAAKLRASVKKRV